MPLLPKKKIPNKSRPRKRNAKSRAVKKRWQMVKEHKKQMVNTCSAFGCTEQFKIGSNIGFFKFPTDEIRRDLWIRAVKRMNWSPSFTSVLCSKHFQTGKPSESPAHPDYIPNIFVSTDSVAKHQSHSSAVQTEEFQCVIHDSNETEDMHFVPQSSSSFPDISGGNLSKDSGHPAVVQNLNAFTNSVEKHRGHSSTAQTEESQCVIYDRIEIEDDPELSSSSVEKHRGHSSTAQTEESQCVIYDKIEIEDDPELSLSSIGISEVLTAGIQSNLLRKGTALQQTAQGVVVKNEVDETLIFDAAEILYESSRPKEDEITILKLKFNQALTSVCTLRKEKVDLLKKLTVLSAQQNIPQNSATEKEELSKLKKELQEAYKEISSLQSEKISRQHCITDRILQDAFKLHFFTGLNSTKDFLLLTKLLHDVDTTATSVSVSSQLMIVLMRLKLNLKYTDLADRFETSIDTIRRICARVIPNLESKLKLLLERLSLVSLGMQSKVSHCYSNTAFVKLYRTIQRYTKSKNKTV